MSVDKGSGMLALESQNVYHGGLLELFLSSMRVQPAHLFSFE